MKASSLWLKLTYFLHETELFVRKLQISKLFHSNTHKKQNTKVLHLGSNKNKNSEKDLNQA